jgi:hypothetical protein
MFFGVGYDIALKMPRAQRLAHIVAQGQLRGFDFDWHRMVLVAKE